MIDGTHETAIVAIVLSDSYRDKSKKNKGSHSDSGEDDLPPLETPKQDKPAKKPYDFDSWDEAF